MKSLDFEIAVKTALLKRGMKNQHLAKSVGVSESYLSDILKGNRKAEHYRKFEAIGMVNKNSDKAREKARNKMINRIKRMIKGVK